MGWEKLASILVLSALTFISCSENALNENDPPPIINKIYSLKISLLDDELKPLPSAAVTFDSLEFITDSSGIFRLDSLKSGSYPLILTHKDYRTIDTIIVIPSDTNMVLKLELKSNSFFPLTTGSWWQYDDDGKRVYTVTVSGTEIINGLTYAVLTSSSVGTRYFRTSNDTLYQNLCSTDQIYAIFNIPEDTQFIYDYCDNSWVISYIATILDQTYSLVRIHYDAPMVWDEELNITFIKGVGLTKRINPWNYDKLLDYDIKY